jgi:uncharacterized membrane protein YgcG
VVPTSASIMHSGFKILLACLIVSAPIAMWTLNRRESSLLSTSTRTDASATTKEVHSAQLRVGHNDLFGDGERAGNDNGAASTDQGGGGGGGGGDGGGGGASDGELRAAREKAKVNEARVQQLEVEVSKLHKVRALTRCLLRMR